MATVFPVRMERFEPWLSVTPRSISWNALRSASDRGDEAGPAAGVHLDRIGPLQQGVYLVLRE